MTDDVRKLFMFCDMMVNADKHKAQELCTKACGIFMGERSRETALLAMQTMIVMVWLNSKQMDTIPDAIDNWRIYSELIERSIRLHFGDIRNVYAKEAESKNAGP